jgi:hypothetical protein
MGGGEEGQAHGHLLHHLKEPSVVVGVGVGGHQDLEGLHPKGPQGPHHLLPLLRPPPVHQDLGPSHAGQEGVPLAHVQKPEVHGLGEARGQAHQGGEACQEEGFPPGEEVVEGEERREKPQVVEGEALGADLSQPEEGPLGGHPGQEEKPPGQGLHGPGQRPAQKELQEAQGDQEGHQRGGQEVGQGAQKGQEVEAVQKEGSQEDLDRQAGGQAPEKVALEPRRKPEGGQDQG